MALTTYPYVISLQTLNGAVDEDKLKQEILATSTITIALEDISRNDDIVNVVMRDALPAADNIVLDAVVGAHDGVASIPPPQLVKIQSTSKPDLNLLFHGEAFYADLSDDGSTYKLTTFDIVLAEERELHGAAASVWFPSVGDRFGLTVVHPQVGVVGEMARQVWVPPDGKLYPIMSDTKVLYRD